MKLHRTLILLAMAAMLMISSGCRKCRGEMPRARIINESSQAVMVRIRTGNGQAENRRVIEPGIATEYRNYETGDLTFDVLAFKRSFSKSVPATECHDYDLTIDSQGRVYTTVIDHNR